MAGTKWKSVTEYAAYLANVDQQLPAANLLARQLHSLRSPSTNTRFRLPLNCTVCWSNPTATCPVVLNLLPVLNEYFFYMGIKAFEVAPGRLALDASELRINFGNNLHIQATLLHCLLTRHRCVEVVEGLCFMLPRYLQLFCDALRSSVLRTLRLDKCWLTGTAVESIVAAIRDSEHIAELSWNECVITSGNLQAAEGAVAAYIANAKFLRILDVQDVLLLCKSVTLVKSLEKNVSIESLFISSSMLLGKCGDTFCRYLAHNATVKKLFIFCRSRFDILTVEKVFKALLKNSTLQSLAIKKFYPQPFTLRSFATLATQNTTLREVKFLQCEGLSLFLYGRESAASLEWMTSPFVMALRGTSSLRRLTFTASVFSENWIRLLLEAATACRSLEEITFGGTMYQSSSMPFYCLLRDTCIADKVRLDSCNMQPEVFISALQSCGKMLSKVRHQLELDALSFRNVVTAVILHDHITKLELYVDNSDSRMGIEHVSLLATYLSSTRALKEVSFMFRISEECVHIVVEGLCENTTIEKLSINYWSMQCSDVTKLCKWVAASRKLCHLVFLNSGYHACSVLLENLAQLLPNSYTLTHICTSWYPSNLHIWKIVEQLRQRNLSLVECAVEFVLGLSVKRAAAAFERLSWHPQVMSNVLLKLQSSPSEVSTMLNECRQRVRMDFWQITGVVRSELVCYERLDGRKQIHELGVDAWLCVRDFLNISDVLDETGRIKSQKRKRR
ncbi:uncharacterized protein LOC144127949 isoform X2 [Amblyomma americanum]